MAKLHKSVIVIVVLLCTFGVNCVVADDEDFTSGEKSFPVEPMAECALDPVLVEEIASYAPRVKQIMDTVLTGAFKGKLFNDTAAFVDTIGPRVVGSQALEDGIDYMMNWMKEQKFDAVYDEEIETPDWKRGKESLEMIKPRHQTLRILGYGRSVPTNGTLEAEIVVVRDYAELEAKKAEVPGKIVVYDHTFVNYGVSVEYRNTGASEAAKRGAVAALVAAVSNTGMDLPHTGQMTYNSNITKIPLASISVDSAEMLGRMYRRGNNITLKLVMEDENPVNMTTSRNVFGQMNGTDFPEEKVIVSGHIDSWDVGLGAQDDGAAVVMSTLVISLIKHLNLTTKRTIQAVGWTSEENGLVGVQGYIKRHGDDIAAGKIAAALESDSGLFVPLGYDFAGTDDAACIVQEIMKLFQNTSFVNFNRANRVGSDISYLSDLQVPTFNFKTDNDKYWWYHHAESDTMSALNTTELDWCLAVYTASTYVIADLSERLPLPPSTTEAPESTTVPSSSSPDSSTVSLPADQSSTPETSTSGAYASSANIITATFITVLVYIKNILANVFG